MKYFFTIVFICVFTIVSGFAQVIKLGTVAPEGSQWHKALKEMAQEWRTISNGKVNIQIYPGGIAGDDPDLIRKMRIGQLQAAVITTSGLFYIYADVTALTFPNNIKTDDELRYVIKKTGPYFEDQVYKKGFKILCWSNAGWVHFFSKEPVVSPDDMRKQKLFFWGSESVSFELMKKSGFNPIPLSVTDLLPGLQTGLVTAFATPPQAALAFQWYQQALNMCSLRWQPLPGVFVMTDKAWEQIPENLRPELEKSARKFGEKIWNESVKLDNDSIEVMKQHGLKVNEMTPEALADWNRLIVDVGYPVFLGRRFQKETFDMVSDVLKEYRKKETK